MADLFDDPALDGDNDLRKGITALQKVEALNREIKYRKYVYKKRVDAGKMSAAKAQHEILVMQAILQDYLDKVK